MRLQLRGLGLTVADDLRTWAKRTEAWAAARPPLLDVARAEVWGERGPYRIVWAPLAQPDTDPRMEYLGQVTAFYNVGEVVGEVIVSLVKDRPLGRGRLYADIQVHPAHRRRGLVTWMMDEAEVRFGRRFIAGPRIGLHHSNDAEAFWQARERATLRSTR